MACVNSARHTIYFKGFFWAPRILNIAPNVSLNGYKECKKQSLNKVTILHTQYQSELKKFVLNVCGGCN